MENNQMKLILRLVVGGYLVYLAYDLFQTSQGKLMFMAAAALFALAGGALFIHALLTLVKNGNFRNPQDDESKSEYAYIPQPQPGL